MIKVSDPITCLIKNFLKEGITFKCNEKERMEEKNHGHMTDRSLRQKNRCSSKGMRNSGFT
jgi:hypothetical protein